MTRLCRAVDSVYIHRTLWSDMYMAEKRYKHKDMGKVAVYVH